MLVLAVILLALAAWGCAVVPAQPYDAYYGGPYYSYSSYYYTTGYYGPRPCCPGPYYRGYSGSHRGRYNHSSRGRRR